MRKNWGSIFWGMIGGMIVATGVAYAHTQITFSNGATISASDLNTNFTRLFNYDHNIPGSRIQAGTIANAQVSASAAIAPSKLATGGGVAKAWADVTGNPVAINEDFQVTTVSRSSQGVWTVDLDYSVLNTAFSVLVSTKTTGVYCYTDGYTSGTGVNFTVRCKDFAAAVQDADWNIVVFDTGT